MALGPALESKARPWRNHLDDLADDPIEEAHQLTAGQFYLLFQHIHRFVLQTNPQKKGLEDKLKKQQKDHTHISFSPHLPGFYH